MPEVRVLHMADIHLEWPFAGLGADRHRARLRREELKEVFGAIVDLALQEQVQVMLIAGDLFEHLSASRGVIKYIDQQFRRISHVRIFISPGNHDPYVEGSYYQTYPWAPNVHIFGPDPEQVDLPDLPVTVCGWGFGAWEVPAFQLGQVRAADSRRINLVVCHGGDDAYHPFHPSDLAAIGADYVALGHIHQPETVLEADGRVIARYSGSPEALSFGEPGERGVWVGAVSKHINRMRFVPTGRRQCISKEVDVEGAQSLEDLAEAISIADAPARRLQHCYRLVLTGAVHPDLVVDLPLLLEKLGGEFYFLRLEDETRPDYDLDRLALEKSARGLFVQRLAAMESAEADPLLKRRIRRALGLGLAAFEGRGGAR